MKKTGNKRSITDTDTNSTNQNTTNAGDLNMTSLQKFDRVTPSTRVYYGKGTVVFNNEAYTAHYLVFKSWETAIKLSTDQVSQLSKVSLQNFTRKNYAANLDTVCETFTSDIIVQPIDEDLTLRNIKKILPVHKSNKKFAQV